MNRLLSRRVHILGVGFDDLDSDEVIHSVITESLGGRGGWIVTPNVDIMRQIATDSELAGMVGRATLVVVDGAPVQWAGRLAGHKHIQRVPGSSLAFPLIAAAREKDMPVLLLGGRQGAAEKAAATLHNVLPGLRVHHHCPDHGFEDNTARWDEVRSAVRACSGGMVLCGFGCPKQERVMERLFAEFPDTWFLGVGGTIDFLAGYVPRAPKWVQEAGFEWVFRLAVEPKRLARRYIVDGLPFAWHLMVWAVKERQTVTAGRVHRPAPVPGRSATVPPIGGLRAAFAPPPRVSVHSVPAALVPQPRIQSIDLDRRTVSLLPAAPGKPVAEVAFTEYLAAREGEPIRAQAGPDQVIDLRDGADRSAHPSLGNGGNDRPAAASESGGTPPPDVDRAPAVVAERQS